MVFFRGGSGPENGKEGTFPGACGISVPGFKPYTYEKKIHVI
jgi:hypothetical protein